MTTVQDEPESNDASIEALLREVGARDEPSAATAAEVMSAVHAEWLTLVQQRRRQQRVVAWRIAAGVVLAVFVTTFAYRFMAPAPEQFGSVVNVDGHLLASDHGSAAEARVSGNSFTSVTACKLTPSRAPLFHSLADCRCGSITTLELTVDATDRITLASGAVYIDAPPGPSATPTL